MWNPGVFQRTGQANSFLLDDAGASSPPPSPYNSLVTAFTQKVGDLGSLEEIQPMSPTPHKSFVTTRLCDLFFCCS